MSFLESEFVAMVAQRAASRPRPASLALGIGDDAAVLSDAGHPRVVTTDLLLDGVDFVLAECGPRAAGRKAMAKNLSDVAAMGARPEAAFVAVALPAGFDRSAAAELLDGLFEVADRFACAIAGGDTKRSSGPLVIDVTLTGLATGAGPVLRSGARPGDVLFVTGRLGGAARGRHLDFTPRVAEGLRLAEAHRVHAMIDLSDGLSTDLARLAAASEAGARIDAERVPVATGSSLDGALNDGEDYELLFAVAPDRAASVASDPEFACGVTRVGVMTERGAGISIVERGVLRPLLARGFEHRFDPDGEGGAR